jgi:hypothetical protein
VRRVPALRVWAAPLIALVLSGCGDAPEPQAGDPSGGAAAPEDVGAPAAVPAFATFDPATIEPGDTVLGLTVVSADLDRALEDSVWVGEVVFEGDLVVHGIYQRHPDWPQVELPCVEVVQPPSVARIPRFPADAYTGPDPRTWFCLENAQVALDLLGQPEPAREVVIALDRYAVRRNLSDVFDTAELAELIETGPTADATLR